MLLFGQRQGFLQRQNAELFAVGADNSDLFRPYCLIDVYCRFCYGSTP
jgi:hypothetical protein